MQSPINLFAIFSLLGASQSLLLALVLVTSKRGNRTANRLLAAFVATASILISWSTLIFLGFGHAFPHFFRVQQPLDYVGLPLLYLYVRTLTSEKQLTRKDVLHFVPAVLCALYLVPFYLQSAANKLKIRDSVAETQWYYVRTSTVILLALVYLTLSGILVVRYLRKHQDRKTPMERAVFFQLKFLVVSFMALWLIAFFRYLIDLRYPAYMRLTNLILPFGATLIIYSMAYLSLRKSEMFASANHTPSVPEPEAPAAKKYEKSTLTPDRAEVYLQKLIILMERDKPYLDGDLTLSKLAAKLSLPTHHLSQIINERLNQNFFDLINAHRVEEAKRKLVDPARRHYSLLAIAEEVGFNSKSAFNAAFKKQTQMTPSDFRKGPNGSGTQNPQAVSPEALDYQNTP
jgi:AraC-like DNA-binding protein